MSSIGPSYFDAGEPAPPKTLYCPLLSVGVGPPQACMTFHCAFWSPIRPGGVGYCCFRRLPQILAGVLEELESWHD